MRHTAVALWAFVIATCTPVVALAAETPIVDPAARELAPNLATRGSWIALLAVLCWAAMRFIKDPRLPIPVPAQRWRPLIVLGLALAAGAIEGLVRSATPEGLFEGLQNGFMAAGGSIFLLQEVIVRSIMGGRTEPPTVAPPSSTADSAPKSPPPMPGAARVMMIAALLFVTACTERDIIRGTEVANMAAKQINAAEPVLTKKCTEGMRAVKNETEFQKLDAFCTPAFATWEALRISHIGLQTALTLAASGDLSKIPGAILAVTAASVRLAKTVGAEIK